MLCVAIGLSPGYVILDFLTSSLAPTIAAAHLWRSHIRPVLIDAS